MRWNLHERAARIRWAFLPLGLCALAAVGAHAAADVVGDRVLWGVDRIDALFDALWSKWSFTAPLVELVGLTQRTWFARAVALIWELLADALVAVPLLGYGERDAAKEWQAGRDLLRRARSPLGLVRPLAALLLSLAGAFSVGRMVQGSLQLALHLSWLGHLARAAVLTGLAVLLVPRAVFRSLEHARTARFRLPAAVVLAPLLVAALLSLR
ncbi:MAG TPA: hypothetical protein VMK66_15840 [Myxococcales bacterium]|nr:hypothetical protein [Myxococcales bacterium]